MMNRLVSWVITIVAVAGAWHYFGDEIRTTAQEVYHLAAPCTSPVTYRIGRIDPSFRISTSTVIEDIAEASAIWNDGIGKKLFAYDPDHGTVVVNFEYDQRQATTDTLHSLNSDVTAKESTYDKTKARYQDAYARYARDKAALSAAIGAYQDEEARYVSEVASWNAKGGAPKDVYARLQSEKDALQSKAQSLHARQTSFNAEVAQVNDIAGELNALIDELNLSVAKYNVVGATSGGEFEQAVYECSPGKQTITIYEYENKVKLVRVLAHELGHALGLEHVSDPGAIMYELNESSSEHLSADDIAEVAALCRMR